MDTKTAWLTMALVMILSFAIGATFGTYATSWGLFAPETHQQIIDQTTVTAMIHSDLTVSLKPIMLRTSNQIVKALDILDIARRARWYGQEFPVSEWAWQYEGHTLLYQKVWGSNEGEYFVEFSKATMTKVSIDCIGQTHTFEVTYPETYSEGFWFIFVEGDSQ